MVVVSGLALRVPPPMVRMQVGTPAAAPGVGFDGPATAASTVSSWYDSGVRLQPPVAPAALLQRYLQLNTVLPDQDALQDDAVLDLITRTEAEAAPVAFDEDTIWGEWQLVWQRNSKQATRSQKALTGLPAFANFLQNEDGVKVFRNLVTVSKRVTVTADVVYTPPGADGSVPPGRLGSIINGGFVTLRLGRRFGWRPLRVPLPLKGKGWLDVTYLSDEMRITRGNRGGVFVHLRPSLLTREAAESVEAVAEAADELHAPLEEATAGVSAGRVLVVA